MKDKLLKQVSILGLGFTILFVIYSIIPKVNINEQKTELKLEAYNAYIPKEILKDYLHSDPKLYIQSSMGWKNIDLDTPLLLDDELKIKLIGKESSIKSNETTFHLIGVDTIQPKIIVTQSNIDLPGGENLSNYLDFTVMDYRYGEYTYELKKPSINYVATVPGKDSYTIIAEDLSGNKTEKRVDFNVVVNELSLLESADQNVWLTPARKMHPDYVPTLLSVPLKFSTKRDLKISETALENFTLLSEALTADTNLKIMIDEAYLPFDQQAVDEEDILFGHSEHQTGFAIDVRAENSRKQNFSNTESFKWIEKNAHEYGFIIRYQEDKEDETHYKEKTYHLRYVGKSIASYLFENKMTFDAYIIQNLD